MLPVQPSPPPPQAEPPAAEPIPVEIVEAPAPTTESVLLDLASDYALSILGVIAIMLAAWTLGSWTRSAMRRGFGRTRFDPTLAKFFSNITRWGILVLGLLAAISLLGVQLTVFAAVVGAAGLTVGLALQGSLSNIAAGIMLLVFRPFKVGDVVNVAGQLGKVNELDLFTTAIDTPDGRRVILPNGSVFGNVIENISHHPRRRVEVMVGASYSADIDATRGALEQALAAIPGALADPPPEVILVGLGSSSVDWQLRVWAPREEFFAVKQATVRAVKYGLDRAGITIPFPQLDVHFDPGTRVPIHGE